MRDPLLARNRDTHALAFPLYLTPLALYAVRYPATVSVDLKPWTSHSSRALSAPSGSCCSRTFATASFRRAGMHPIPTLSKLWLLRGVLVLIWPLHGVLTSLDSIRSWSVIGTRTRTRLGLAHGYHLISVSSAPPQLKRTMRKLGLGILRARVRGCD
jgi:hypothetical protein